MMEAESKKVCVFAAYQLGVGENAKMVGGESENKFEVSPGPTSQMLQEIEMILAVRHKKELKNGAGPIIVHHFQLISF